MPKPRPFNLADAEAELESLINRSNEMYTGTIDRDGAHWAAANAALRLALSAIAGDNAQAESWLTNASQWLSDARRLP